MAVAGLVCGIVGIFLLNIILGPLALIFGGVGLRNAKRAGPGRTGMATAASTGTSAADLAPVESEVSRRAGRATAPHGYQREHRQ
ncbi:DUF4190 domain-containing protein [Streptacidiphilus sp. N1-12]|uniref:DUF4190 domain-containing protein n=2 Tax=Streptacidiphilus alkalitolerans TaxID=3342712 RepID=A0ABV6WMX9_9ACTN